MSEAAKQDATLFISDLHLDSETTTITATFLDFLSGRARSARALYILGDLFEAWVGDDDDDELVDTVASALNGLSQQGTEIFLMHGNRDFLIGEAFARRCGATLLPEVTVIDCHGYRLALVHGDSLCTRDVEYMRFRRMVRSAEWQQDFLARSLIERQMIVQQARQQSREANSLKASDIMDVTHHEVEKLLEEQQVNYLVHGHTHRPAVHTIRLHEPINGSTEARRIVLGSWEKQGWALELTSAGFDLKHFPLLSTSTV